MNNTSISSESKNTAAYISAALSFATLVMQIFQSYIQGHFKLKEKELEASIAQSEARIAESRSRPNSQEVKPTDQ